MKALLQFETPPGTRLASMNTPCSKRGHCCVWMCSFCAAQQLLYPCSLQRCAAEVCATLNSICVYLVNCSNECFKREPYRGDLLLKISPAWIFAPTLKCVLPQCQSIHLYSSYTQPTNTNTMLLSNHLWDILIFVKDTKRRCTLRCLQMDSLQAGLQL